MPQRVIGCYFAFHRGNVGQSCSVDQVADSVNTGEIGLQLLVDAHTSPLIVESLFHQLVQAACVGAAADGHQDILTGEGLFALLALGRNLFLIALVGDGFDPGIGDDGNAAFGEDAYQEFAYLFVKRCQHVR